MIDYIYANRDRLGVETICEVLPIVPSTYRAAKSRPPSARALRDEDLKPQIARVHEAACDGVYGVREVCQQMNRENIPVARCIVGRLMRELGLSAVRRGALKVTTVSDGRVDRLADLVDRKFSAVRPNQSWVTDITYVATWNGFVHAAFVIDAYSRMIVSWRISSSLRSDLAIDALGMAVWSRRGVTGGVIHHSDRGAQYLSIRYTERFEEAGAVASVGSSRDSYDNALAETVNGLWKREAGPLEEHR